MNPPNGPVEADRKAIAVRLLYSLLFLIAFEVLKTLIQLTVAFQYVYLLAAKRYSEPLRGFSNRLSAYAYELLRYLCLNSHRRPFPFRPLPEPLDPPEEPVRFE